MTDQQIRNYWAEFYPIFRSIIEADAICRLNCEMILWRARATSPEDGDSVRVTDLCRKLGIPTVEYWDVAESSPNPKAR